MRKYYRLLIQKEDVFEVCNKHISRTQNPAECLHPSQLYLVRKPQLQYTVSDLFVALSCLTKLRHVFAETVCEDGLCFEAVQVHLLIVCVTQDLNCLIAVP